MRRIQGKINVKIESPEDLLKNKHFCLSFKIFINNNSKKFKI